MQGPISFCYFFVCWGGGAGAVEPPGDIPNYSVSCITKSAYQATPSSEGTPGRPALEG